MKLKNQPIVPDEDRLQDRLELIDAGLDDCAKKYLEARRQGDQVAARELWGTAQLWQRWRREIWLEQAGRSASDVVNHS